MFYVINPLMVIVETMVVLYQQTDVKIKSSYVVVTEGLSVLYSDIVHS